MLWSVRIGFLATLLCAAAWGTQQGTLDDEQLARLFGEAQQAHGLGDLTRAAELYERIVAARPDLAEAHSNLGIVYYMQARYELALTSLGRALEQKPGLFVPVLFSGMAHARMRRWEEAIPHLEQVLKQRPRDPQALLYLGMCHASAGRAGRAQTYLELAARVSPDSPETLYQLGRNYLELSLENYERVQALEPEGFLHRRILAGIDEAQKRPLAARIERQRQIAAARPDYPGVHWDLAQLLLEAGQEGDAADALAREIQVEPRHLPAMLKLAELKPDQSHSLGARVEAVTAEMPRSDAAFAALAARNPKAALSLLNALTITAHEELPGASEWPALADLTQTRVRLWAYATRGVRDDWALEVCTRASILAGRTLPAAERLSALAAKHSGWPMPYYLAGGAYLRLALEGLQRLYEIDGAGYRRLLLEAESLKAQGREDEAVEAYNAAIAAAPQVPGVHYRLGLVLADRGRVEEAARAFEREVEIDPYHLMSRVRLAEVLLFQERPDEAITVLNGALRRDPALPLAHAVLGRAHLDKDDLPAAVEALESAIRLDPEDRQALYLLARTYQRLDRQEDAKRALAAFQKLAGQPVSRRDAPLAEKH